MALSHARPAARPASGLRVSVSVFASLLVCLLASRPACADYGVGRLAGVQGTVNVLTSGDPVPHQAQLNEVLAQGDQLASGFNSTTQLEFAGVQLSLGPASVLVLTRVETDGFAAYLAQGSLAVGRLDDRRPASVTVDGPQVHAGLDTAGRFRLDVALDPALDQFTVWQGRATAEVDQRSFTLYAGQVLDWAPGEMDALTLTQAASMDNLDLGLVNAVQGWRTFAARPYLGPDWIGAAALDQQGNWLEVTSVGPLWVPFFLPPGWAPYRSGHWTWNGVWGWVWLDDLPWAYTTFHFGRWIWWNNRWAWSPQGRRPLFSAASPCPGGLNLPPLPAPRRTAILSRGSSALISASVASTVVAGRPAAQPPLRPNWTITPLAQAITPQRLPNRNVAPVTSSAPEGTTTGRSDPSRTSSPPAPQPAVPGYRPPVALQPAVPGYRPPVALQPAGPGYRPPVALQPAVPGDRPPVALQPAVPGDRPPVALQPAVPNYGAPVALPGTAPAPLPSAGRSSSIAPRGDVSRAEPGSGHRGPEDNSKDSQAGAGGHDRR